MSRTYRFLKTKTLEIVGLSKGSMFWGINIEKRRKLIRLYPNFRFFLNTNSKEARKIISMAFSDNKTHYLNCKGPGWYHNEFSQKPHRSRAKTEIVKYMKNNEYEVIIENKPKRIYWL